MAIGDFTLPVRVQVHQVTVRDALGAGIVGGKVDVRESIIVENGLTTGRCGVFVGGYMAKIRDSLIANNGCGVFNHGRQKSTIAHSTITDNVPLPTAAMRQLIGVYSGAGLTIRDSIVTKHLAGIPPLGPRCDFLGCGDIVTFLRPPRLLRVQCGTSIAQTQAPVATWGLCENDDDFDREGTPNAADGCDANPTCALEDVDGDGVGDCCDDCPAVSNPNQFDSDFDNVGDACDPDIDGDGTPNEADLCAAQPGCDVEDADGHGVGDCCDDCPTVLNPSQLDRNANGIGDECE